ncbi:hypothetical protein ABID26_001139 [Mesorhizobium shonense]|uniref:Uncharacterized protein n=1 Tax=Mesorhizobium shonense TaxID=1209948 RepID=A0ABV2HMG4_9HYPH
MRPLLASKTDVGFYAIVGTSLSWPGVPIGRGLSMRQDRSVRTFACMITAFRLTVRTQSAFFLTCFTFSRQKKTAPRHARSAQCGSEKSWLTNGARGPVLRGIITAACDAAGGSFASLRLAVHPLDNRVERVSAFCRGVT